MKEKSSGEGPRNISESLTQSYQTETTGREVISCQLSQSGERVRSLRVGRKKEIVGRKRRRGGGKTRKLEKAHPRITRREQSLELVSSLERRSSLVDFSGEGLEESDGDVSMTEDDEKKRKRSARRRSEGEKGEVERT